MTATRLPTTDGLDPVRRALTDRARADADEVRARARADAAATTAHAEDEARAQIARAREEGTRDGELVIAAERARAHRRARDVILAAQRAVYDELRARLRTAATAFREDPAYPALRERLTRQARELLGPQATVRELPAGGIEAATGTRRLVWSLPDLAEHRLAEAGADVVGLWVR